MLSSICFSLASPLTTQVYSTVGKAIGFKTQWPITFGDVVFHACNYSGSGITIYRENDDKTYKFISNGTDWTPVE